MVLRVVKRTSSMRGSLFSLTHSRGVYNPSTAICFIGNLVLRVEIFSRKDLDFARCILHILQRMSFIKKCKSDLKSFQIYSLFECYRSLRVPGLSLGSVGDSAHRGSFGSLGRIHRVSHMRNQIFRWRNRLENFRSKIELRARRSKLPLFAHLSLH